MRTLIVPFFAFVVAFLLGHAATQTILQYSTNDTAPKIENTTLPIRGDVDADDDLEIIDDELRDRDEVKPFTIRMLETGNAFHGDQISAKNGEKWLGLFSANGKYFLRQAVLRIKRVPDEMLHGPKTDRKGKLTGKSVGVNGESTPIFLLKNASHLRIGEIMTRFVGEKENYLDEVENETFFDKDFRKEFEMAGRVYELKVVKAKNTRGKRILVLMLESEGKRQILSTYDVQSWNGEWGVENWSGSIGALYWIGDLDRDNKPDFFLSIYPHETMHSSILLLSKEATEGKFVESAATFTTSGCG